MLDTCIIPRVEGAWQYWWCNEHLAFRLCEKCGTHTMAQLLRDQGFLRWTYADRRGWSPTTAAFVCRNPYTRAVSTWWDITRVSLEWNIDRVKRIGSEDFYDFVRWLLKVNNETNGGKRSIYQTQTAWMGDVDFRHIVHLENLRAELKPLFGDIEVPHLHSWSVKRDPWETYYDAETKAMIGEWAAEDFERFGYDR
jgi:hypothetical protein